MLVLSLKHDVGPDGIERPHPMNQWLDRAGNAATEDLFLQILVDINRYMPEEWRMTLGASDWRLSRKIDDEFRIEICIDRPSPELKLRAALVGHSFRVNDKEILHIVDTVVHPTMFSPGALRAIEEEDFIRFDGPVTQSDIKKNPELVVANMYYFMPCPEGSPSPLFARQYERLKYVGDKLATKQYHRIHPLMHWGLDREHFRWVLWNLAGEVRFVPRSRPEFRGKTYWGLGELKEIKERATSAAMYKQHYRRLCEEQQIPAEDVYYGDSPYVTEFKYQVMISTDDDFTSLQDTVLQQLCCRKTSKCVVETSTPLVLDNDDYTLKVHMKETESHKDLYLDDESYSLLAAGVTFRLRERIDVFSATLKKRHPGSIGSHCYKRIKEEQVIRESQAALLKEGKPIHDLPFRLIAFTVPECGPLRETVTVETTRKRYTISDTHQKTAELRFDRYFLGLFGNTASEGPFYEIELQSMGMSDEQMQEIAAIIETFPDIALQNKTKYGHAVPLFKPEDHKVHVNHP